MARVGCAIVGSGNIGTDLMIKIIETSSRLSLEMVVGIEEASEGLAMARERGVATCHEGLSAARTMEAWSNVSLVFDATSAGAHQGHHEMCQQDGKQMVDLTPAAIGPYCVPVVNLTQHLAETNVNMVTCGGQATIPMVHAVRRVGERLEAEGDQRRGGVM